MQILFIRFPLESAEGGAENQTTWLMKGLAARGHTISFLGSCEVMLRRAAELKMGNGKLKLGAPPVTKFGAISFFWRKAAMQKNLIAKMETMTPKPEAIVMLSLSEKLLLTEWAVNNGIRVLWVEHDTVGRWLTKNPWLSQLRRLSASVTTVCVSELSKKRYLNLGWPKERTVAIPNGVPLPPPSQPVSDTEQRVGLHLGCIARLSPEKGVDILLSAIRDIPDVTLTIVGQGPEEGYIRKLIDDDTVRHGTARIQLLRRTYNVEEFYASINILVLPSSDHDPFGLTAAEAMMRGVPTIVTNLCGIAGYLHDREDALVVPAGSEKDLAEAISTLLDPSMREKVGQTGKVTAGREFSLVHMIDRYEELLKGSPM